MKDDGANGAFDFPAGFIGVVDDAVAAVSAFSAEVELVGSGDVESRSVLAEPFNGGGGVLNQESDGAGVIESGTGDVGVLLVEFPAVAFSDGGGDAPLRPVGVVVFDGGFGEDGDFSVFGGFEGEGETGEPTADHEKV